MSKNIFIGPYKTGLQKNLEPFMLPEEAFTELQNAYVWRGRVKKKEGYTFLGRLHSTPTLPEALGVTAGAGTSFAGTLTNFPVSPGTLVIDIGGIHILTDNGNGTLTAPTGTSVFGTIDYETGAISLTIIPGVGAAIAVSATAYRFLTRNPVMALGLYENIAINEEDLIAHDTEHSYLFNTGTGIFDELLTGTWGANNQWTSSDSDFVWTTNYFTDASNNKLHWATNNIAYNTNFQDGIQFYNGTAWTVQQPQIDVTPNYLRGGLICLPYRDRLIVLNTLEGPAPGAGGAIRHTNRVRWCQNGTPLVSVDANAWREDIIGKGGFIDAPTGQAIVSAAFNKDTLVVFFERSTWRLRYTGNELLPFVWEQINAEYGAESTFSSVIFDKGILGVGDKRIVAADSINVTPIDEKIPDEVYNFHNDNEGPKRVYGIRDFFRKLVYWTFPNDDPNETFPDKVLVYNYDNGSWSIYNDSFTCFGRWQKRSDYTWATLPYESWSQWTNAWGDPRSQSFFPNIIAGNQKGLVLVLDNTSFNEESMDLEGITNAAPAVFTIPNHNLKINQFVRIKDCFAFGINVVAENVGTAVAGSTQFIGTLSNLGVFPSTAIVTIGALNYQDLGNGTFIETVGGILTGTINYATGQIILNFGALGIDTAVTVNYAHNILNYRVFKVNPLDANTFELSTVSAQGALSSVNFNTFGAPYTGTGKIEVINNFLVKTKRFSPFLANDMGIRMVYNDIFIKRADGNFLMEVLIDQDNSIAANVLTVTSEDEISAKLYPEKTWKRVFTNAISDFIQLQFRMSDYQMTQFINYSSEWELHAMNMKVSPSGRSVGGS